LTVISWTLTVVALLPHHLVTVPHCDGTSCVREGADGHRRAASHDAEREGEDDTHHVFDHPSDFAGAAKIFALGTRQAVAPAPVVDATAPVLVGGVYAPDTPPPRSQPLPSRAARAPPAL
jgi:hypothetical protein